MTVEEILDALDATRERLLTVLEPLPDEALEYPGTIGIWSVKDLLAHLAAWESELVTGLLSLQQGKKPTHLLAAMAQRDTYNAQRYEENKERDLDRVFADFQDVRMKLESWIEEFNDRALKNPSQYKALNGQPLWQLIKANSFGHEGEHVAAVGAFAARWLREHPNDEEE
jgi:uncharacterized damage-inducible protein DinB